MYDVAKAILADRRREALNERVAHQVQIDRSAQRHRNRLMKRAARPDRHVG